MSAAVLGGGRKITFSLCLLRIRPIFDEMLPTYGRKAMDLKVSSSSSAFLVASFSYICSAFCICCGEYAFSNTPCMWESSSCRLLLSESCVNTHCLGRMVAAICMKIQIRVMSASEELHVRKCDPLCAKPECLRMERIPHFRFPF